MTTPTKQPIPERLAQLSEMKLDSGSHGAFEEGHCAMELVAWLAGQPHTDSPPCACPVVAKATMRLNDRIGDTALRTELLRPLLPRIVGSRASREVMVRRGYVAADMAVRVFAPLALEARGRLDLAKALRECAPIVDRGTARAGERAARPAAADDAAYAAAYAAYAAAYAAAAAAYAAAYAGRKIYEEGARMISLMLDVTEGAR
jgi:hypothetical protein